MNYPDFTFVTNKVVSNVGSIVHTETHGNDQVDTRHHVYGQAPEVDETSNIDLQKRMNSALTF